MRRTQVSAEVIFTNRSRSVLLSISLCSRKQVEVMELCKKIGYKYIHWDNITGAEDQVVILLRTNLMPENITRGINMLIILSFDR